VSDFETYYQRVRKAIRDRLKVDIDEWAAIRSVLKEHPRTDSSAAPFLPPYGRCVICDVPHDGQDPCEAPRRAVYFVDPRRDPRPGPDPLACPRCGDPPACAGAVYCGAACAAEDGA
jgi:hypothetical protein